MTKRAFIRSPMGEVISAVVPRTSMVSAFQEGERFSLWSDLELPPYAVILAGTMITVLAVCMDTGMVDLGFDHMIAGLHHWGHTLTLVPYDTDDTVEQLNKALHSVLELNPGCVIEVPATEVA